MDSMHIVYQHPVIHCGKCQGSLVFPRKRDENAAAVLAGEEVLAECINCSIAVMVPAALLRPSQIVDVKRTEARPWTGPHAAVLTEEHKKALGHIIED